MDSSFEGIECRAWKKRTITATKPQTPKTPRANVKRAASSNSGDVVVRVNPLLYAPKQRSLHRGLERGGLCLLHKVTVRCFQKKKNQGRRSSPDKTNGSMKYSGGCSLDVENTAKCRPPGHETKDHSDSSLKSDGRDEERVKVVA